MAKQVVEVMKSKVDSFFAAANAEKISKLLAKANFAFYKSVRCPEAFRVMDRGRLEVFNSVVPANFRQDSFSLSGVRCTLAQPITAADYENLALAA
jgi:hypothetical protein